ncbi:hypothetical protein OE88DRAFT_1641297 [Heliocybe sulcata]|uniref:Uncharacterized protein n=1 Tax=Heliocybe sulcata TaxID=5364 RepID=A0A5C3NMN3_9AGAM|nr:hypothetical protein OE88DRAFT_1641297 [Heliocybe sulcata]
MTRSSPKITKIFDISLQQEVIIVRPKAAKDSSFVPQDSYTIYMRDQCVTALIWPIRVLDSENTFWGHFAIMATSRVYRAYARHWQLLGSTPVPLFGNYAHHSSYCGITASTQGLIWCSTRTRHTMHFKLGCKHTHAGTALRWAAGVGLLFMFDFSASEFPLENKANICLPTSPRVYHEPSDSMRDYSTQGPDGTATPNPLPPRPCDQARALQQHEVTFRTVSDTSNSQTPRVWCYALWAAKPSLGRDLNLIDPDKIDKIYAVPLA